MVKFQDWIQSINYKSSFFRIAVTGLLLVVFMVLASVLIMIFGAHNPDLNLMIFITPIMIVYLGTGGSGLFDDEKISQTWDYLKSFRPLVAIAAFIVPFIIFLLVVPLIQLLIPGEPSAVYLESVKIHFIPAAALGVAGVGGILKKTSIVLSLLCLAASPLIILIINAGTL